MIVPEDDLVPEAKPEICRAPAGSSLNRQGTGTPHLPVLGMELGGQSQAVGATHGMGEPGLWAPCGRAQFNGA